LINKFTDERICSNEDDNRPIFIFLSQGTHHNYNPEETIEKYIHPLLSQLNNTDCGFSSKAKKRYEVAFSGLPAIHQSVYQKYVNQTPELAHHFNTVVRNYLRDNYAHVKFVDMWNLTLGALDRTSDGFHSMTDVNVMKVMFLFNAMNFLA
jgi:hypothetical protein